MSEARLTQSHKDLLQYFASMISILTVTNGTWISFATNRPDNRALQNIGRVDGFQGPNSSH